jgi:hypothetical protein
MKPLAANLKHFYQCRPLWVWYSVLLFGGAMFAVTMPGTEPSRSGFLGFLFLVAFVVGIVATNIVRDVLSKPFSFGLPGHERTAKRMLGAMGGAIALAIALTFLFATGGAVLMAIPVFVAALAVASTAYLAGVRVVFGPNWVRQTAMAFIPALVSFGSGPLLRGLYENVEGAVRSHSGACLLACLAAGTVALPWLRAERLARDVCGRPWSGMTHLWNQAKVARVQEDLGAQKATEASRGSAAAYFDAAFWVRFAQSRSGGLAHEAWGQAFALFSRPRGAKVLGATLLYIVLAGLFGYTEGIFAVATRQHWSSSDFVVLLPCLYIVRVPSPLYSTLPLAGGREERLRRELVIGALTLAWGVVVAVLFLAVHHLAFALAVTFSAVGRDLPLRVADPWTMPILTIGIAASLAARLFGPQKNGPVPMSLAILVIGTGFFWIPALQTLPAAGIVLIVVLAWALYFAVARRTATKRDLAG